MRTLLLPLALACHDPEKDTSLSEPIDDNPSLFTTPPLGSTLEEAQVTFRLPSRNAVRAEVWIYPDPMGIEAMVLPLARSGDLWEASVSLDKLGVVGVETIYYGFRVWGPNWIYDPAWVPGSSLGHLSDVDADGNRFDPNKLLSDPYGRELSHEPGTDWWPYTTGEQRSVDTAPFAPKSVVLPEQVPVARGPHHEPRDQVIYEVHVRGLTMLDPTVPEELRGTYAGAALRAPALAELGVTAIELLPVYETSNDQNDLTDDASGDNYWGYSSLSFFSPDRRYAADTSPGGPTAEFRAMVEAFHAAGIDVILDVVYNHTAEGGTWGDPNIAPLLSWRGIDNAAYYELSDDGQGYRNDNGVGPNINATDPLARQLVLDSLRYWSLDLGVDGFRFDLAPILGNSCSRGCMSFDGDDPAGILFRAANELDALLIAEPWGATGEAYQGGNFPDGWAEWNDSYRDTIRADQNQLGAVLVTPRMIADALNGSYARFGDDGRQPTSSVSYLVSHDGFTLADLYRCNTPDNDQPWPYGPSDGGSTNNLSWDQGGDEVQQLRVARSGMALMLLSAGIPMFNGGDELLHSQQCNNNPYNIDSIGTWLDWPALEAENDSFLAFTRGMIALRKAHPALRPATWRSLDALRIYDTSGLPASEPYLDDPNAHALALWLDGPLAGDPSQALLVLYNGWSDGVSFALPPAPSGERWRIAADTHEWLAGEDNVFPSGTEPPLPDDTYLLGERSVAVLVDP